MFEIATVTCISYSADSESIHIVCQTDVHNCVFLNVLSKVLIYSLYTITGWERTGQMLCIMDTSLSVLMTLRMCLRELCCLFTVWI